MADLSNAVAAQIANMEQRTGKSVAELTAFLTASGLRKHGELRDLLKRELGMGHGDANMMVHVALQSHTAVTTAGKSDDEVLDAIYAGPKAPLRPLHNAIMTELAGFGEFEIAPKKTYVSLRRSKQFAMIGPATKTQIEVGLNMKGEQATDRLLAIPPGGMCNYKVRLSSTAEVDPEFLAWLHTAYDASA